jgi:hypothetical protein
MMLSRERSSVSSLAFMLVAVGAPAGTARIAYADNDEVDESPPSSVARSAEAGAFLPSALSARSEGRRGLATVMAGWDGARDGAIYDVAAEASLVGPVSLRAGALHDGPGTDASPHVELRLDAIQQATHGLDMAVAAGYSDVGFNTLPAAVLRIAVGRTVGASYLLGNAAYQHSLEEGDRSGELRLAALHPVSRAAHVGIDSRFQIDLERDNDEPVGEAEWEWRGGFVASHTWNRFVLTGSGGVSALRLRTGGPTAVGPMFTAGFGTVF